MRMSLAGLAVAALAAACASSGAQAGRTAPGPNQYLITAEEFATANVSNLYDGMWVVWTRCAASPPRASLP